MMNMGGFDERTDDEVWPLSGGPRYAESRRGRVRYTEAWELRLTLFLGGGVSSLMEETHQPNDDDG